VASQSVQSEHDSQGQVLEGDVEVVSVEKRVLLSAFGALIISEAELNE
jgi:hypothetical protein